MHRCGRMNEAEKRDERGVGNEKERDTDDIFINTFLLMIAASTNLSFDSILQNRLRIMYIIRLEFLF